MVILWLFDLKICMNDHLLFSMVFDFFSSFIFHSRLLIIQWRQLLAYRHYPAGHNYCLKPFLECFFFVSRKPMFYIDRSIKLSIYRFRIFRKLFCFLAFFLLVLSFLVCLSALHLFTPFYLFLLYHFLTLFISLIAHAIWEKAANYYQWVSATELAWHCVWSTHCNYTSSYLCIHYYYTVVVNFVTSSFSYIR